MVKHRKRAKTSIPKERIIKGKCLRCFHYRSVTYRPYDDIALVKKDYEELKRMGYVIKAVEPKMVKPQRIKKTN